MIFIITWILSGFLGTWLILKNWADDFEDEGLDLDIMSVILLSILSIVIGYFALMIGIIISTEKLVTESTWKLPDILRKHIITIH